MRLYITAAGRFVGTQDDARKDGKGWHLEEVPTDKAGLIDYLNELAANVPPQDALEFEPAPPPEPPVPTPVAKPVVEHSWGQQEPRMFSAGRDNNAICEAIGEMTGNPLARVAEAVAWRFGQLAKEHAA